MSHFLAWNPAWNGMDLDENKTCLCGYKCDIVPCLIASFRLSSQNETWYVWLCFALHSVSHSERWEWVWMTVGKASELDRLPCRIFPPCCQIQRFPHSFQIALRRILSLAARRPNFFTMHSGAGSAAVCFAAGFRRFPFSSKLLLSLSC